MLRLSLSCQQAAALALASQVLVLRPVVEMKVMIVHLPAALVGKRSSGQPSKYHVLSLPELQQAERAPLAVRSRK